MSGVASQSETTTGPSSGTSPTIGHDNQHQPVPSKKRKATGTSGGGSPSATGEQSKPVKRLPSCDLCRARKVKCVKNTGQARCDGCVSLNQMCEYTHERRKPGPANSFARKPSPSPMHPPHLQRAGSFAQGYEPHRSYSTVSDHRPDVPYPTSEASNSTNPPRSYPFDSTRHPDARFMEPPFTTVNGGMDASFMPISPDSLLHPMPGEVESSDGSPSTSWPWGTTPSGWDAPDSTLGFSGGGGWDPGPTFPRGQANDARDSGGPLRKVNFGGLPQPSPNARPVGAKIQRLEEVLEWSTMMRILHAYRAHLYPLMPIVHWPSFSQQLIAREDERSEPWRAFLLSLVAYSIIQLPRSTLTFLPVSELRRLHQRCLTESRKLQNRRYIRVALMDVATLYCQHIYLGTLGRTHAANVTLAEAIRLAQILGLHDERMISENLDVVELEMRRRVFWVLYGSDRTITALTLDPMHIYDADLCLPLPLALDDNLLTPSGAFPQPTGTTPVLAGFHYNTRLFRLLGAVLTAHRALVSSTRDPTRDPFPALSLPPPPSHAVWTRPAAHFYSELENILAVLPGPLQLVNPEGEPTPKGSTDGTTTGADRERDLAAFAICRANLLVTQALVRFAIRQYAKAIGEPDAGEAGREWAERDVLGLLETMSPESLAANGDSLRAKVLFVATSLLDKYPSTTEGHNYVSDFLAVYTRISQAQHVSLLEPSQSGELTREASPVLG